ncbi:condensation domain-containing protein, partial [Jeotgalicoccus sp. S0W5]|uniref:condensation domain-containing protein n=1 Tax=Jeotgalicoccus sp. S0W5 TaxID=2527874 RepID=UPI001F0F859E
MKKIYRTNDAQNRILFSDLLSPDTGAPNIIVKTEVHNIDVKAMQDSINHFVNENEMMRIQFFKNEKSELRQYISDYYPNKNIDVYELLNYSEEQIEHWVEQYAKKPFPLFNKPLYEFSIVTSNHTSFLLIKAHHAIIDGVSIDVLIPTIVSIYKQLIQNSSSDYIDNYSIEDYIDSEKQYNESSRFKKDKDFWDEEFKNIPDYLISDSQKLYTNNLSAKREEFLFTKETKKAIEIFCEENKVSMYTLFMSSLFLYFSRTKKVEDLVIGTFFANRKSYEKKAIGMFVSTVPFRMKLNNELDIKEFISSINKKQRKIMRHQRYPYNRLIQDLRVDGHNINQLFNIGFEYQEMEAEFKEIFSGYDFNELNFHIKNYTHKNELVLSIDYRVELFNKIEINQLITRFVNLIMFILKNPERSISEINMLTEEEEN